MGGGGTENHIYILASGLDKKKFTASICYFHGDERENGFIEHGRGLGIEMIGLPVDRIYSVEALRQAWRLRKIIKERDIDIVQTFHFKSDTYGALVSKLTGRKVISSRRDMGDLKKRRQIFLNKIANRWISRHIMVCDAVGKRFHEMEGIPDDSMVTLYNGVDLSRFSPVKRRRERVEALGISEGDFIVGTVASFRPEKAYHILFQAIKEVSGSIDNLKVLALGDGPTRIENQDWCRANGLDGIVKFMGHIDEIEECVPLMDVFCLVPNKNEGFSNSILEAMAMGKPVIATNVGGNAEAVVHGETGFIIPPNDPQALAKLILKLYTDRETRLKMGKKARERAEEVFPLKLMVKKHEDLYEEVSNGTGKRIKER